MHICRGAPLISHILFVNDSFLFYKASVDANKQLLRLLQRYLEASRHLVNTKKISINFSRNVPREVQSAIKGLWGDTNL